MTINEVSNKRLVRKEVANETPERNEPKELSAHHQLKVFQRFGFQKVFGEVFFPLFLMTLIPVTTMVLWHVCRHHSGSLNNFYQANKDDTVAAFKKVVLAEWKGSSFPVYVIGGYMLWAITLTIYLPAKDYCGPVTDKGNTPVYRNNGFPFFLITLVSFVALSIGLEYLGYSVTIICDRYGEFMFTMNALSLLFCGFLYLKGKYWPSSSDNGSSGNPVFDYYWGVELYPRIGRLDLKLLTNCRWGMMIWTLVVILFWMKSLKVNGFVDSHFVTMLLIVSYLTKFFWWEAGYMKTIDICVDRAGFYLCYGCLCFVPLFYALPSIYLAYHPVHLGPGLAIFICVTGFAALYMNYDADRQRYLVRETNAKCLIWNQAPRVIRAKYVLLNGKQSENILLASGYWGLSRHFHYLPEVLLAFSWCTTAAFQNLLPYLYFIFLTILLIHRSIRDDTKCLNKYGKYWLEYRKLVPYKIVPMLF